MDRIPSSSDQMPDPKMTDHTMNASAWANIARCAEERSQAAYQDAIETGEGFPLAWRELTTCLMAEKMASQLKGSNT
jgi:hypothetical protein